MGNCQTADAATVVIQHPGGRIERIYWSLVARQVMASNPGHYVAVIITSRPPTTDSPRNAASAPVKHLKLLRPDDTLHIGHLYRLISFEEVLRDFASKKHVRLGRLLVANQRSANDAGGDGAASSSDCSSPATGVDETDDRGEGVVQVLPPSRTRQWRPALQSIAEVVGS